ncbi:MAG: hypothetical protein LBG47_10740 [Prevotellaceae bacterium]|jgi:hypothetical protein|nr:hypothetical protein [Prevotellaceae bacterium]
MKVLFLPEVREYFRELVQILYEKNYLGFESTALRYAEDLFSAIADKLPMKEKRHAPAYFDKYGKGMFYATFKKSKYTQWYVFFNIYVDSGEVVYLVRYISNSHVIAQLL